MLMVPPGGPLPAVGESVVVDLRVQAADQEMVEIAERILTTEIDPARVVKGVPQHVNALLIENLPRHDLHAGRHIPEPGASLAQR